MELLAELLKELSNHNERIEERKAALCELLKLIRENTLQVWDEHFKTILLLLLETMGDTEVCAADTESVSAERRATFPFDPKSLSFS